MKKVVSAICILVVMLAASVPALAANIQVVTEPQQIVSAGLVRISFSVTNDSAYEMRNISISGHGAGESADLYQQIVPPGGALSFSLRNIEITADMLGQQLIYTLNWSENDVPKSQSVAVDIGAEPVLPAVDMKATRTADKKFGKAGEKVILTYTLTNPGQQAMSEITITDSEISGSTPVAKNLSLEGGATSKTTFEYTLGSQDAVSRPIITYKLAGANKRLQLDPLSIAVVSVKLEISISQGSPSPEGVLFTIVLKNIGNQAVEKLRLTDELGNNVNEDLFRLDAGKDRTLSYPVSTSSLRNVFFKVTGMDTLGNAYEDKTRSYEVWPYVDPSHVSLSLIATVLTPLSDSGRMLVRFTVQNNSNVELTNATISEAELGTLETLDLLPLGQTMRERELLVGLPRELEFTLTASDPSGAQHSYQAKVTAAHVEEPVQPTPAPEAEAPEPEQQRLSGTLITVLIVLASLMAVAGVALLALSIYERRRNAAIEREDKAAELSRLKAAQRTEAPAFRKSAVDLGAQEVMQPKRAYVPPPQEAPSQLRGPRPQSAPYRQDENRGYIEREVKPKPMEAKQQPATEKLPHAPSGIRNRVRRVQPTDKQQ
ncbi:MAG: hypothetical protein BWY62_00404 [Firmicutes bacterium ADurb.Bin356]|nr:MAG: hypothetical protein BWY62_00404 [Firmicutes bacterium ADurb.Bin356]